MPKINHIKLKSDLTKKMVNYKTMTDKFQLHIKCGKYMYLLVGDMDE